MKIIVASDSHGDIHSLIDYLGDEKFDMLFYLGDYVKDGLEIADILNIPYKIVRGNGDYGVRNFYDDELFELKDKKIFLTHGHKYNVSLGLEGIYYKAKELKADYALFGHTHIPIIEKLGDIIIMNPGSTTSPRTSDRQRTFGIIELGKNMNEKIIKIN